MNFSFKDKHYLGFTLVELTIVIIVIAILASVVAVAYSGMQNRAKTTVYAVAANQAEDSLLIAGARGGLGSAVVPKGETLRTCLGDPSSFSAKDGFGAGECIAGLDEGLGAIPLVGLSGGSSFSINTQLSADLATAMSGYKTGDLSVVKQRGSAAQGRGIGVSFFWQRRYIDSETGKLMISYTTNTDSLNTLVATLYWLAPDTSSCGRGDGFNKSWLDLVLSGDGASEALNEQLSDLKALRDGSMTEQQFKDKYPDAELDEIMIDLSATINNLEYMIDPTDELCVREVIVSSPV